MDIRCLLILLGVSFMLSTWLPAQTPRVFPGYVVSGPERYGDQLLVLLNESDNLVRQGRMEDAILLYDQILAQYPTLAPALMKRAELKERLGRFSEARADVALVQRTSPYAADVYNYTSSGARLQTLAFDVADYPEYDSILNLKIQGDLVKVLQLLDSEINLADKQDPLLYKFRGNVHLLLGQHGEAEQDYTLALQLAPSLAEAMYNRGISRIFRYNWSDGCHDLKQAIAAGYEEGRQRVESLCGF